MSEIRLNDDDAISNYLNLFKISENKYLIGIFHQGITVYKQQVRALNIFQAMVKTGKIDVNNEDFTIGVIGAGVAGITFAGAAAKMDIKVTIFEKHSVYMHMQWGCETRVIHPNIYDWPSKRSTFSYAKTPILQWKAGTASKVAKQIVSSYKNIKAQSKRFEPTNIFDCKILSIKDLPNRKIQIIAEDKNKNRVTRPFDLLIFATGYGIELGISSKTNTHSYWRNDDYGQTIVTEKPRKYFLSGIGDGGLLDLFRLKFLGFSIESFLSRLSQSFHYEEITAKLESIKLEWKNLPDEAKKTGWLREKFEEISPSLYQSLVETCFNDRNIEKCELIVHGKEKNFLDNLHLDKISMLNAFIAFLISRKESKFFSYNYLQLKETKRGYSMRGKTIQSHLIVRHGTNRKKSLANLLSPAEIPIINALKARQESNNLYNNTDLLFGYESLYSLLNKNGDETYAFYTPETATICSSFIAVLANAMKYHQRVRHENASFRMCLHRVINRGDALGFQQITPYFGHPHTDTDKNIGRVHPIDRGVVGLSIESGEIIYLVNKNDEKYDELIAQLNLGAKAKKFGGSALAIPILGKLAEDSYSTNLVCFFESTECNFFQHKDVVNLILYAIEGFMNYVNISMLNKEIVMEPIDFQPPMIHQSIRLGTLRDNACFIDVSQLLPYLQPPPHLNPLKFENYHSFDVTYNESVDNLQLYLNET